MTMLYIAIYDYSLFLLSKNGRPPPKNSRELHNVSDLSQGRVLTLTQVRLHLCSYEQMNVWYTESIMTGDGLRASVSVSETDPDSALQTPSRLCLKEHRTVRSG